MFVTLVVHPTAEKFDKFLTKNLFFLLVYLFFVTSL